ncbi:DUF5993 family protein [Stappia sp.]|uniref:DUF5993 family protein n=1 Tax=Stappia sp. TaxID=1870903 RepID=UPI003A98DAB0
MYIAAVFLLATLTLASAAKGSQRTTTWLALVSFAGAIAVYFHHASDRLPLSF